jgi:hypothetical protein
MIGFVNIPRGAETGCVRVGGAGTARACVFGAAHADDRSSAAARIGERERKAAPLRRRLNGFITFKAFYFLF